MTTRNFKTWLFGIVLVMVLLALGSCYPKRVGPPGPSGERLVWTQMGVEQKKALMAESVLPRAAAIFRAWRPERFSQVNCTLCHGPGAVAGNYRMPTDHLPRLSGEALLGPEFKKHPETTRLKLDRLVPMMSETLGLGRFSLITHKGFGCYSCHLGPTGPMFGH